MKSWLLPLLLILCAPAWAKARAQGFCQVGGAVLVSPSVAGGVPATRNFQQSFPRCTVTVFLAGTGTPATIFSNNTGTPLTNPFTADQFGVWFFYALNGRYDVQISGGTPPPALAAPYTFGDILLFDPASVLAPNVLDFGAKCDGSTDDAQAIQNAISAVHTAGGGTVVFPASMCAVATSATGKDGGVTSLLQKWSNVNLLGMAPQGGTCISGIVMTAASGTLFVFGDTTNVQQVSISNMCLHGNAGAGVGILLGGDPSGTVSPTGFYSGRNIFNNVTLEYWASAVQYGLNAFEEGFNAVNISSNGTGINCPTNAGPVSGGGEYMYGGEIGGNTVVGLFSGFCEFKIFGTNIESNLIGIESNTIQYIQLHSVHFESNGTDYKGVAGTNPVNLAIYGGQSTGSACTSGGVLEFSGTAFLRVNITDWAVGVQNTENCPLIDANVTNPGASVLNIRGLYNFSGHVVLTAASNVIGGLRLESGPSTCLGCDTSGTGGTLAFPGVQVNSPASGTFAGYCLGPQTLVTSACDWTETRNVISGVPQIVESGLIHAFNNAISLPGGIQGNYTQTTAPGVETNFNMGHTGAASTSNVYWRFGVPTNNTDLSIYLNDGSGAFPQAINFVYATRIECIAAGEFCVHAATGSPGGTITTDGTTAHTGGTCSAWTNGLCTAP